MSTGFGRLRVMGMPPPPRLARFGPAALLLVIAACCAVVAMPLATAGSTKWLMVTAGVVFLSLGLLSVRDRPRFVLILAVFTLQFMLYKAVGAIDYNNIGGAAGIYVTSLDFWMVILYAIWLLQGTLVSDLREAFATQRVLLWVALLAGIPAFLSMFTAADLTLAVAEVVRMAWMYALLVYVAVRVRTRQDVIFVVGALFVVVLIQAAFSAIQWKTHSSVGLSFLGEETQLQVRDLDGVAVARPSGTVRHPDFLAALVAPVGLICFSLGLNLKSRLPRNACMAFGAVAMIPLVVAQTRASLLGAGVAGVLLALSYLLRKRLRWRWALASLFVAGLTTLFLWGRIQQWLSDNLSYDRLDYEVRSRVELNWMALDMAHSSPLTGIGLNNFIAVFDTFDTYGAILHGRPVHNLFLLVLAETGMIGLAGMIATGVILITLAVRVARSHDRLLGGLAAGIAAVYVFFVVEELLTFSLRQDMPLALIALLSGLLVATARLHRQTEAAYAPV